MPRASAIATATFTDTGDEPVYAFGRERRMHARAYDYWVSLLRGRRMPCVADIDSDRLKDFADRSVLVEIPSGGGSPTIAFLGRALRDEAGIPTVVPTIADVPQNTLLGELLRRLSDIVAHQAPVGFEAEFVGRGGDTVLHRGILLPFADERGVLASVYGVMSWKQVAAVEPTPDIAAAIDSVMASRRTAPVICAWGDGPGAALTAAESLPPQSPEQQLATARTWAALAATDRTRGNASLHTALSAAYDYLLACRDQDLSTRKVVTLIFGTDLSRRDRMHYVATLDHAVRLGLGPGRVADWLENHSGGHTAIALAERKARRAEGGAAEALAPARPSLGRIELSPVADVLPISRRTPRAAD